MGSLRQPASIGVYRDMWVAFTAWCPVRSPVFAREPRPVRPAGVSCCAPWRSRARTCRYPFGMD